MYKHLIISYIFFICLSRGKLIPPGIPETKFPIVSAVSDNNKNLTHKVLSEAGSGTHINAVTLPSNDIALLNLEKNTSVTKETSVVARKGVNYDDGKNHEDKLLASDIAFSKESNIKTKPGPIQKGSTVLNVTILPEDNVQKLNITNIHKPLLVSSEAIEKMDKINNVNINDNSPHIKAHAVKTGSHPEIILPIVITILVVPMFAIVGYLALKRGQEAWNNRHYKRMDFLLDGMYND